MLFVCLDNIELLEAKKYKYIIGARIKNESKPITEWLLVLKKRDGLFYEYQKTKSSRLIVGYSEKRAKKDCYNREKGIKRLEKEYKSGSITKDKVNKRGYNKFLEISDETMTKTMLLTPKHKSIAILFDDNFWKSM